ncbi:unnamed protein product, partial [Meganyctiphanes norvegica]
NGVPLLICCKLKKIALIKYFFLAILFYLVCFILLKFNYYKLYWGGLKWKKKRVLKNWYPNFCLPFNLKNTFQPFFRHFCSENPLRWASEFRKMWILLMKSKKSLYYEY